MQLKIHRIERDGSLPPMPEYPTEGSCAFYLHAFLSHAVTVPAGERALIPTGIQVELPPGCSGLVLARSGLAARAGLTLANGVGLVDCD